MADVVLSIFRKFLSADGRFCLQTKFALHGRMRRLVGRTAELSALGSVSLQIQEVSETDRRVIPRQGLVHGPRVRVSIESGKASTDLQRHLTLGGEAHGKAGPVQSTDGVKIEGRVR